MRLHSVQREYQVIIVLAQDLAHLNGRADAHHVLYWMRTALRGHENPALDVAAAAAAKLGLPLVVAAFVLRSHTHPTARRCQFWLQGLRDTQLELRHQVWGVPPSDCPDQCTDAHDIMYSACMQLQCTLRSLSAHTTEAGS